MQHKYNKYLALILCFAMVLALIPAASFADAGAAAASAPVVQKAKDLRKPTEKAAPEAARADTYLDTPLTLGTNTCDVGEGETVYRPFVPSEDGLYWFYSDCDEDTYGYLQDADHNVLSYNDDGGNGMNFSMRESLTGGETYYLGARFYSSSVSGSFDVCVEQLDATACGDNLHWSYDAASGKLTITGYGDMWYFGHGEAPWYDVASDITSVSLPDGLTFIGDYAFFECYGLTSVVIPEGVERIGDCAFLWCDGLERVTFPQSLIRIGNSAFESCGSLRDAVLPDALEMLDGFAFYGSGLNEVFVPASVYYIGTSAFAYCYDLLPESFAVDPANANYQAEDGVLFSKDGSYLHSYLCTKPDTAYTVPSGVTEIGTYAFSGADSLCSVTLSEGVSAVDLGAFAWCTSLNSVTIADTVTEIAAYAFYEDSALTDVFYLGTEQTRNETLSISTNANDPLLNASWHYQEEVSDFDGTIEWN
ncbi:MAG: leucine-rich repeat domain-containing protein, partial [Clostridia bacterium]|nr:leucine-rich repeat domain-containing protein [Clostridia bacterium]